MPTTVHLPPELLRRVDRRAAQRRMSRNGYIREALERALESERAWSEPFREMLEAAAADPEAGEAVEELRKVIGRRRSRKPPPTL